MDINKMSEESGNDQLHIDPMLIGGMLILTNIGLIITVCAGSTNISCAKQSTVGVEPSGSNASAPTMLPVSEGQLLSSSGLQAAAYTTRAVPTVKR